MAKLVIKGAIYKSGNTLLRPHYTGEFHTVDCTQYFLKSEIKANYSNDFYKKATGKDSSNIVCNGIKYYECEYGPYHTNDFELLSDLSDLEYFDYETDF